MMNKKLLSLLVTLTLVFSCSVNASANESKNYASMSNEEVSRLSGIPVEDLIEAREVYGDDFNSVVDDYINSIVHIDYEDRKQQPVILYDGETGIETIAKSRISNERWNYMKEKFKQGQILITDDAGTLGYNHGHAAILATSTITVEHLGKNTTEYSGYYDVSWWQSFDTIKSLKYNNEHIMIDASNYAFNNLQGKSYNVIANRTSDKVNCATLVWKAYNSQNVNIVNSTSGTVIPQDFDTSNKLTTVRSVAWNTVNWGF